MERICRGDAYDAGARVIGQTVGATQVRVEMRLPCSELQQRQHALPDQARIGGLRVGPRMAGSRREGSTNHWQGRSLWDRVGACRVPALPEKARNGRGRSTVTPRRERRGTKSEP